MKGFMNWMQGVAVALGGPGLLIIGFLDSSFLSFPMINDLMVIGMVTRHKSLMPYYVLMATAGSWLLSATAGPAPATSRRAACTVRIRPGISCAATELADT